MLVTIVSNKNNCYIFVKYIHIFAILRIKIFEAIALSLTLENWYFFALETISRMAHDPGVGSLISARYTSTPNVVSRVLRPIVFCILIKGYWVVQAKNAKTNRHGTHG